MRARSPATGARHALTEVSRPAPPNCPAIDFAPVRSQGIIMRSIIMNPVQRVATHLPVILVLLMLCQCSALTSTKIGDIKNHPREYAGKEVTVSGEVTRTFSLLVVKYFTLRDSTGEITIVTQRPMPREGERLTVKGTVREAFSLGTETLLVIEEKPEKAP